MEKPRQRGRSTLLENAPSQLRVLASPTFPTYKTHFSSTAAGRIRQSAEHSPTVQIERRISILLPRVASSSFRSLFSQTAPLIEIIILQGTLRASRGEVGLFQSHQTWA